MAPVKFGIFKARSRDHQEQPSTENLLRNSNSSYNVPGSPVPSTSKGLQEDFSSVSLSMLTLDSDEEEINYELLKSKASIDTTSTNTLHEDFDHLEHYELDDMHQQQHLDAETDEATSCDVNSEEFGVESIAARDLSIYCASLKKPKKRVSKEEKQLRRDLGMWQASNVEVMQNLLSRSGTHDEQIKWEAIATARGLCTLTDSCTCHDCTTAKYLAGVTDGDGGLGAAPLFSAMNMGCQIQ